MKTSTELSAELLVLQGALADAQRLAAERSSNSYRVQSVNAAVTLGHVGQSELQAAQNALNSSVEAVIQVGHLNAAIAELNDSIVYTRGQERAAMCHSVRDEFSAAFATYTEQSKALLATFKQMNSLSNRHLALTGRGLIEPDQSRLCLPAVHRPEDDIANFPTGVQVLSGAIK